MLSRKYYRLIAESIEDEVKSAHSNRERIATIQRIVERLEIAFKCDNPNFRPAQFREACGL